MRFSSGVVGVAPGHQLLDGDCAFDRGDDGGKLEQEPVARRLDDAPAEARHDRPRRLAMLSNAKRRPRLVLAHQARVADDVGGEDRGEAAGRRHSSGTPALRRPSMIALPHRRSRRVVIVRPRRREIGRW